MSTTNPLFSREQWAFSVLEFSHGREGLFRAQARAQSESVMLGQTDFIRSIEPLCLPLAELWVHGGKRSVLAMVEIIPSLGDALARSSIELAWSMHPPSAFEMATEFGLPDAVFITLLKMDTAAPIECTTMFLERMAAGRTIANQDAVEALHAILRVRPFAAVFSHYGWLAHYFKGDTAAAMEKWIEHQFPARRAEMLLAFDQFTGRG
jgi:hypothetical protein